MRVIALVLVAGLALSGCARSLSPDVYSRGEVGSTVEVEEATVLSVRAVKIEGTRSNIGAGVGAAAGGIGGSYAGKRRGAILGAIAGAVVGAIVGAVAEDAITSSEGVEYLVRLPDGETRAVVQPKGATQLPPGSPVLLVYGDHIRVVPAPANGNIPDTVSSPAPVTPKAAEA
ncbi:MAG: glycine zipper domain-containing protein [Alphaproteobacteria bacterium]|jgi:outer membrane lipoprotein SlyB